MATQGGGGCWLCVCPCACVWRAAVGPNIGVESSAETLRLVLKLALKVLKQSLKLVMKLTVKLEAPSLVQHTSQFGGNDASSSRRVGMEFRNGRILFYLFIYLFILYFRKARMLVVFVYTH